MNDPSPEVSGWTLRDLPLSARLTLALFLISVGLGYFSALINLHFQSAKPGEALPTGDDAVISYHAKPGSNHFVHLLEAHPSLPFNGQGSMRAAFGSKAPGLARLRKTKAAALGLDLKNETQARQVEDAVMKDLDGERRVAIAWALMEDTEKQKQAYDADEFPLIGNLAELPITPGFSDEMNGKPYAKIKRIIDLRCTRCHSANVGGAGSQFPLDNYEDVALYTQNLGPSGKSLSKLAMTTHVHLLGFSMLYGLTGLFFALTALPGPIRFLVAPLPLLAQVVDISFWWLARLEGSQGEMFARLIPISGGIVAVSLAAHIFLTLWSLFGTYGRIVLLVLILAAAAGAHQLKDRIVDPYLNKEKEGFVKLP